MVFFIYIFFESWYTGFLRMRGLYWSCSWTALPAIRHMMGWVRSAAGRGTLRATVSKSDCRISNLRKRKKQEKTSLISSASGSSQHKVEST